jgi:hypothetical protein
LGESTPMQHFRPLGSVQGEQYSLIFSLLSCGEWFARDSASAIAHFVRSEEILYRTFRRHTLHPRAKRIVYGLESLFLKIDVAAIVVHKTHQPNIVVNLFDTHGFDQQESERVLSFIFENADSSAVDMLLFLWRWNTAALLGIDMQKRTVPVMPQG